MLTGGLPRYDSGYPPPPVDKGDILHISLLVSGVPLVQCMTGGYGAAICKHCGLRYDTHCRSCHQAGKAIFFHGIEVVLQESSKEKINLEEIGECVTVHGIVF